MSFAHQLARADAIGSQRAPPLGFLLGLGFIFLLCVNYLTYFSGVPLHSKTQSRLSRGGNILTILPLPPLTSLMIQTSMLCLDWIFVDYLEPASVSLTPILRNAPPFLLDLDPIGG